MQQAISYHRFSTRKQAKGDSDRRYNVMVSRIIEEKGWILNETLSFRDAGKSGFHGVNVAKGGDLARFLSLIERKDQHTGEVIAGPVKPGNVLIVESIDRISRKTPYDAFKIVQQILDTGVYLFTGFDGKLYTLESVKADPASLQYLWGQMMVAYEYSMKASKRASASWEARQANAAIAPITTSRGNLPGWIECNAKGERVIVAKYVAVWQQIIKWAISGMGDYAIIRRLYAANAPCWTRNGSWQPRRFGEMLRSRILIGEYQPRDTNDQPKGEPVKGYYQAVCEESEFYAIQSVRNTRKNTTRGRRGPTCANLFGTLARSGDDGSVMRISGKAGIARYVSVDAMFGKSQFCSFPYAEFESAFLRHVGEIDLSETPTPDLSELASLEGQIVSLQARIDRTEKAAEHEDTEAGYDAILKLVPKLASQMESLIVRRDTIRAKANRPQVSTADVAALVTELESAPAEAKVIGRERLKGAIQQVVDSIRLYVRRDGTQRGSTAVCVATVTLRDGLTRVITVATGKGHEPISAANAQPFRAEELDARRMADRLIAGPLDNQIVLQARTAGQLLLCGKWSEGAEIRPTSATEFAVTTPAPPFDRQTDSWVIAKTAT